MRTQRKENYYYVFWTVAMIAFIVPQVFTAYAYMSIKDLLDKPIKVEYVNKKMECRRRKKWRNNKMHHSTRLKYF